MSAIRNMDSYLKGFDIHEFLASIGKHAIEKVTHGSSDMRTVKPECSNMVFVEDTNELAHFDNGCGIGGKEDKGFTFGGCRESTQKENTSGWGAKKKVTVHECKGNLQMEDNSGWGEEIEVSPSGWESSTQKENKSGWETKEASPGGWDKSTHQEDNAGWGEEKKVASAGWGKGKQREESCTGWGSNTQMEGNAGWGDEKYVTAGRGRENKVASAVQEEDNAGWEDEKDVAHGGWGKGTQEERTATGWRSRNIKKDGWGEEKGVPDDGWGEEKNIASGGWGRGAQKEDTHIGWGSSIQKEGNGGFGEGNEGTAGGREEERKVVSARWGKGIQKEDICTGWGSGTQKKGIAGRGETNAVIVDGRGEEKTFSTGGWGKDAQKKDTCTSSTHRDGWEEENDVAPGGWGKGAHEDTRGGGGSSTQKEGTAAWEEAKEVNANGWGQSTQQKVDDGWGEEKEVTAGGWGEAKDVAPGGWGEGAQDDTRSGGGSSAQKEGTAGWEEVTADGWGQSTQQKVDDGWGEIEYDSGITRGWGENTQKVPTRNKDFLPNSDWAKADDPSLDARWRGKQKVVTGDNNGWDRPFKSDTRKTDSADGWDSMQGQNPRNRPKKGWSTRSLDPLVSTESHGADERRSGTFGPSGTNAVPLGKRKSLLKASNGNAEKGHGQSDWAPQLERGSDSTNQFVASVPESETPNANVQAAQRKDAQKKDTRTSSTQRDGWEEEKEVTAGGWGEENDVAPDGWGKGAQEDTHSGGGSSTQKEGTAGCEEAKEVTADGWGQSVQHKVYDGWGEEKEVGGWGEEKDVASGGWGEGTQDDSRSGGGSSAQKEGTAGWEEAKEVTADGWGQSTQQKVDDGWGEIEYDSGITHGWGENTRKEDNSGWGLAQNVPTRNKDFLLNSDWAKADDPSVDARWGGKQKVVTGDNNGWDRPFKSDTRKTDSADGWDSMQGQNPRNQPKKGWSTRSLDPLVSTESHGADERRSGTFGPSRTNTVPLGKRKSFLKASNGNAEKGHGQSDWAPQPERGSDSTNQFVASVPESETPNANVSSMRMESEEDGWANSEQTQPLRNQSLGRSNLNSKTDHEAAADSNGWGSELPTSNNSQVDGWNDTDPDAQGETLRPNKRVNRRFPGNSWTGSALNGPHNQNRWPRLKALINLAEYSEVGELYKAANKILHYNGYQPGDKLNPEDEKFVLEKILVHHRDKEAKLGCGVEYVMIDSHSEHQVSCFWVVRKDGSKTDFSYWKCLENLFEMKYPHVEMKEVHKAGKDCWGMGTKSAAPFRRRHPQEADTEEAKDGW